MKKYDAEKVAKLAKKILHHKKLYYQGSPEVSDQVYDRLEDELRKLDPKHPVLQTVGTESQSTLAKVKHDTPILSLAKTYAFDDLVSWKKKQAIVGTLKIDGNCLSLIYEKGELIQAKTRGNGEVGEDVTAKIFWVKDCLRFLGEELLKDFLDYLPAKIEIRGELYCAQKYFVALHQEMGKLGLDQPSSPRNVVAGILGRKQHIELARYFNFFAFDVLFVDDDFSFSTEMEKYQRLQKAGFSIPRYELLQSTDSIKKYLELVQADMQQKDFGIDGAVFTMNDIAQQKKLGATAHHPRYKISFKWQGETATTRILKISWMTSRFGVVTPVAEVEPVTLSGASITNVTLHNASYVRLFQLKKGDKIEIVRSGEVIPKFLRVISAAKGECKVPEACPSCGGSLVSDEVKIRCMNSKCFAQILRSILNWIRCVGIDDLSEKRLLALMDIGLVKTTCDLYRLQEKDFLELPQTKEKLAKKLYQAIQKSKNLPLSAFLSGLGIEGAGGRTWKVLISHFASLEGLLAASAEEIASVEGFAEKTAGQIVGGLKAKKQMIQKLFSLGVSPFVDKTKISSHKGSLPFEDKTFVITGTLSRPRAELVTIIENLGGEVGNAVSKKTHALIIADLSSSSTKAKKARELGVELWSEEELLKKTNKTKKNK